MYYTCHVVQNTTKKLCYVLSGDSSRASAGPGPGSSKSNCIRIEWGHTIFDKRTVILISVI